jgi:hypothetical protein
MTDNELKSISLSEHLFLIQITYSISPKYILCKYCKQVKFKSINIYKTITYS